MISAKESKIELRVIKKTWNNVDGHGWIVELSITTNNIVGASQVTEGCTLLETLTTLKREILKKCEAHATALYIMDAQLEANKIAAHDLIISTRHSFENLKLLYEYLEYVDADTHYNIF